MEHVVGPQDLLETVCIGPDDDMERRRDDIRKAITRITRDKGVILLTDMFDGTPSNLAISMLSRDKVEVVAGVNLPMLIKLAEARSSTTLIEAAQTAKDAGQRYIAIGSEILAGDV